MRKIVTRKLAALLGGYLHLLLILGGCERGVAPEAVQRATDSPPAAEEQRHTREFVFVGERAGAPLVVPFTFSAVQRDTAILRTARGWLAHGDTWDLFLDDSWSSPTVGGVWRVLPREDLRVIAGDLADVSSLAYRRGERALRLRLGNSLSAWNRGDQTRYRVFDAQLTLGGEVLSGRVVEAQRIRQAIEGGLEVSGDFDWLFITDGREIHFLLAEGMSEQQTPEQTFAWSLLPEGERIWNQSEVRWLEMLALEPARRDVPVRWSYRIPEAGIEGELSSLGYDVTLGPDRPGRRTVELRHTVEGWVQIGDEQYRVFGMIRHSQE